MTADETKQHYIKILDIMISSAKKQREQMTEVKITDYLDGYISACGLMREQIEKS